MMFGANFTVKVTDSATPTHVTATKSLSITIYATLTVTTSSLSNGTHNVAYNKSLAASGGNGSYTWSLSSGSLPPGLSLSAAGVISGTPTTAGNYSFTVQVTDGVGNSATKNLSLRIN